MQVSVLREAAAGKPDDVTSSELNVDLGLPMRNNAGEKLPKRSLVGRASSKVTRARDADSLGSGG
jgi:hypothetical protein